jgi:hypothetical protein
LAAAGSPLRPGDVLAGRYRLEDAVVEPQSGPADGTSLWRAVDDVLERPVAVKAMAATGRAGAASAQPFLHAAGLASTLAHPGLARVYDAALEERRIGPRRADVAYVVSEWVDGRPLSEVLAEGPFDVAEAVDLAVQACEAVAAAHARGTAHGRLHLGNLLLTDPRPGSPAGRVVVTDAAVAAAVDGVDSTLPGDGSLVADDTRDLAAITYALLTGRWPADATPQPAVGVPAAPGKDRRTYSPRQVRAGLPRELDAVVTRALAARVPGAPGGPSEPRALAAALEQAGRIAAPAPSTPLPQGDPGPPPRWRRALPYVASVAFVAAFASGTYALGKAIGELPGQAGSDLETLTQPTPQSSPGAAKLVKIPLDAEGVTVRDFDPQGDKAERPAEVGNAFDGDVTTSWLTSRYKSATFGGLGKQGVGLLVDLGASSPVARVDVALTTGGGDVEVLVGDTEPKDATDLRRVARKEDARDVVRLGLPAGTRARWVLIWLTRLPEESGGFREGIDELVLVR